MKTRRTNKRFKALLSCMFSCALITGCIVVPQAHAADVAIATLDTHFISTTVGSSFTLKSMLFDVSSKDATYDAVAWNTSDSSKVDLSPNAATCVVSPKDSGVVNVGVEYTYTPAGASQQYLIYDVCKITIAGLAVGKSVVAGSGSTQATYKVTSASSATYVKTASSGDIAVPDSINLYNVNYRVSAIADKAAYKAAATKVTIGGNVGSVGASSFASCSKLAQVSGGAALGSIASSAFASDSALKSLSISSASLKTIGSKAFNADKKLTSISITKTTKLTKKSVKNSLKGSSVKTVHVKSSKVKAYKKFFTKANCGKKVTVKK